MNGSEPPLIPPPLPAPPPQKSGMPPWGIMAVMLATVILFGAFIIGLLAAIAIPNFVRARDTAQRNACANNMRAIEAAKQQWALANLKVATETPTESQLAAYLGEGRLPTCPAKGTYSINSVGGSATCSAPKHGQVVVAVTQSPAFNWNVTPLPTTNTATDEETFDVILLPVPAEKKIAVVKAIREVRTEIGLAEAKNLTESTPTAILQGASKTRSEAAKQALEAAGATVEVQ